MNSLYGAIGNAGFRFFNNYVAESITLTGQYALRLIEKDIDKSLNSKFKTDNWKYLIYVDTDSVAGDTQITVNGRNINISDYFDSKTDYVKSDAHNKDYVKTCGDDTTLTVRNSTQRLEMKRVSYVMKHRVKKRMYKITVAGKSVTCTEDHSVMIRRNGVIVQAKPHEIISGDELIRLND